jgi:hypothetical protein
MPPDNLPPSTSPFTAWRHAARGAGSERADASDKCAAIGQVASADQQRDGGVAGQCLADTRAKKTVTAQHQYRVAAFNRGSPA